ncbi:MAG: hypothetical protein FJ299_04675 [Planctomycetes bacterium]|nr:hypothetical protein [Planctomycetota bacterium]
MCVLLLAARAVLVLSLADAFFTGEEQAHGTVAKAILDGVGLPWPRLIYQPYEGGGLVASILTAPVFAAFGPSLLSQKLVAFGFDLLNLIVGCSLCARWFGLRALWFFGLGYVFGPAACQQTALLNVGNHFAAISIFLGVIHLAMPILTRGAGERVRARECLWLGCLSGFGCWFSFQVAALVAVLAFWLVCFPPRLSSPSAWGWLVLGFAIGVTPLVWMWKHLGVRVFQIHGRTLGDPFGGVPTASSESGWYKDLVAEMTVPSLVQVVLLVALPFAGAIVWWMDRSDSDVRPRRVYGFVLLFLIAFTIVSLNSSFKSTSFHHFSRLIRYMPQWGLALLLTTWALERLARGGSALRRLAWGLVLGCAALGALQTVDLARRGSAAGIGQAWTLLRTFKGYEYADYLPKLFRNLDRDREELLRVALRFEEPAQDLLLPAAIDALREGGVLSVEKASALVARVDARTDSSWLVGMGAHLVRQGHLGRAFSTVTKLAKDDPRRDALLEAIGRYGRGSFPLPENCTLEAEFYSTHGSPAATWRGLGWRIHQTFRLDPAGAAAFLDGLPEGPREAARSGYEQAFRANRLE